MDTPEDFAGRRVVPPAQRRAQRGLVLAVAAIFLTMMVLPRAVTIATDWFWFSEIGYQTVFLTSLKWHVALFAAGALVAFGMFYGNVRVALGGADRAPILLTNHQTGASVDLSRLVPRVALGVSIAIALSIGLSTSAQWLTFVQAVHGVETGTTDPVFNRDIGYYLFSYPALQAILDSLIALLGLTTAACGAVYVLRGALTFHPQRGVNLDPAAARHAGLLIAAVLALIAARLWIVGTASLLWSNTGPLVGASNTDVGVELPAIRLAAAVALVGAGLVVMGALQGRLIRMATIAIVSYAGVSLLGRTLLPAAVQKFVVVPNELERERPYLERHVQATRAAWGLDDIETRDLSGEAVLTMADIQENAATIENVRLWERHLVQQTFSQLQEIRTYYDFVSVADDRYLVDGRYRQVHISARELNSASLPTRGFINERLTFTHGMGVTMAPVNQVTGEGLPVLFLKDLPPVSTTSLQLTRPQVYYGQLTNSHVFVGTDQQEFDYPSGESNVQTRYAGTGGVPVGSVFRRALYAMQLQELKMLLSNDIRDSARILYRRNIEQRARTALPFLIFDPEPAIVVTDNGELKWILDAYTRSSRYPYSQRTTDGVNYMRNSVKVVIDAYHGTVEAYIAEPDDPLIQTYSAIFPGIFKPLDEMPPDLRRHVRYPGVLFRIQAALHTTYHMVEPETFYHREDQWQFPTHSGSDDRLNPYMRHIILRLPGESDPEFIYMVPFTPRGKDNLAAWMVARMDGEHYGKLVVYRFPKQSLVFGPRQVTNRINQDTEVSRQLTLWDQSGSTVIRGELLVIPIEESLIYVLPIFLRAEGGTIPELKRVVVAYGNRVVMSETLESGLAQVFGGPVRLPSGTATPSVVAAAGAQPGGTPSAAIAGLLRQAQSHYERAIAAQRAGNWAEYGREIELLGEVLRQLGARQ